MKTLITGITGTLAPRLAAVASRHGAEVVGWPRHEIDPENIALSQAWMAQVQPTAIFHLGMGSVAWAERLAHYAARHAITFVFTSTAMVFHHEPPGPHARDDARNAQDSYGQYKIACEDAIRAANPAAAIARIGWQIDPTQPGNNMLMALDQWQAREGCVAASRLWYPACSFMEDTAEALFALAQHNIAGTMHLDSNADEAHTFAEIVHALKRQFARDHWVVREHEDYRHDQRLINDDDHLVTTLRPLSQRLAFD